MNTAVEEIVVLRRRNEHLSERVAYLEGQLSVLSEECPTEWKLTTTEARLMGLLVRASGRVVSRDSIITAMWNDDEPDNAPRVIDVYVCRIRKKIAPFGVTILTLWGKGLYIRLNHATRVAQNVS